MEKPSRIYELLLDYAGSEGQVTELTIGLVWTVCKAQNLGLAMSPGMPTRTLPWSGTLVGKTLGELAAWINDWEPYKATVGMAAINCSLNRFELPSGITLLAAADQGNLAVFEHFLPRLKDKKVVVVGRYPGIERYAEEFKLSILERQPVHNDYPDPACEFLLPEADWVFLTASSITNKTFPRLAELAQNATTVLMGPTVPIHHGAQGGNVMASNQPVNNAEPSIMTGLAILPDRRRQKASKNTADDTVIINRFKAGQPKHKMPNAVAGAIASMTCHII